MNMKRLGCATVVLVVLGLAIYIYYIYARWDNTRERYICEIPSSENGTVARITAKRMTPWIGDIDVFVEVIREDGGPSEKITADEHLDHFYDVQDTVSRIHWINGVLRIWENVYDSNWQTIGKKPRQLWPVAEEDAQQDEFTVPVKAAPSASSPVR